MSLTKLINQKLKAREFKEAGYALRDNKNASLLYAECMDMVSILLNHLTEDNLREDFILFSVCENLLKFVAEKCAPQEVLFELLEKVELTKNDDVFTSVLKILQVVILRLQENKARSLEWSLNSIFSYIDEIELPSYMNNIGAEEEKLLECDETIRRILQLYMIVLLFLKPIIETVNDNKRTSYEDTGITRKNVVISFILQLMGKPLVYLNLHHPQMCDGNDSLQSELGVKTYSRQVAEDLTSGLNSLLRDPYKLLQYGERRLRWSSKKHRFSEGVFEDTSMNIFMSEEKCPLLSLGMFHYLLIGENLLPYTTPMVYSRCYIFEMGLYYVTELISDEQTVVHYKGILFAYKLLTIMGNDKISSDNLDIAVHQKFCKALAKLIVFSAIERNRRKGTLLLRDYIYQFDDKGRYLVIVNLLKSIEHSGLRSYIAVIYKDLISIELNGQEAPSEWYVGKPLKQLLLMEICVLKKGIETDLVENADTIISGLNILRFLMIRDKQNVTSIWDCIKEVEKRFLIPLRKSIDLARAHFKQEQSTVEQGMVDTHTPNIDLTIGVLNGEKFPELTKEKKLEMLTSAMNTFDLMDCLLARVIECVDSTLNNVTRVMKNNNL